MMNLMSENDERTIEKIISLMQTDKSVDAPEDAVRWTKNLFRARRAVVEPRKSIVKKVLAVLQMDLSGGVRPALGERSASVSTARQMLFQAGEIAIDLRIKRDENDIFSLRGQILGKDFAGGFINLGDFETSVDEVGEFELAGIAGGKYDLILQSGDSEIVVENLELI